MNGFPTVLKRKKGRKERSREKKRVVNRKKNELKLSGSWSHTCSIDPSFMSPEKDSGYRNRM